MKNYAKQSEILFLWDVENSNPNGDILNDNAPRYDEVSHRALISDVRVKRTIRDDLFDRKNQEIFIRETASQKGGINDGKARVQDVVGKEENVVGTLIDKCIDVRAFGGVFPVGGKAYNLTGSIQFKMTKSLHEVKNPTYIKGTGAFASTEGANQKTFREEYILPYALFGTYGVVNGLNSTNTKLTANDVDEVIESLVMGTKNLITRSKMGQYPRFLLKINYKENGFFIGELDNRIKVVKIDERVDVESDIRSVDDYTIDMLKIEKLLEKYSDRVESVEYFIDDSFENKITIPKSWTKILD
ncbi:MAG: CRISPR-associated protein, Csd2/Csh2 family [uncultured Sulfurovum sp.]|uniref:CRISPR-associated protein, Csd2/Csh2 family n=1 Tax=uncultured Sulfurovum sp. TaxID=269237 RepID=A0A6S6SY70_9BACT|nr:MAG: CRISPR-associated protein, Csd2/Csh2 family [uncultured Sulfurovum sp.]